MYKASINILSAYIFFTFFYFAFFHLIAVNLYPTESVFDSLNRFFFWLDKYVYYFGCLLLTSIVGMVYSRVNQRRRSFFVFTSVFILATLFVLYAMCF